MSGEGTGRLRAARARHAARRDRRPAGQTEVVIDPSMTAIWRRRVVAAVIDMTLVVGVLATLVYLQVVRLTRDGTGLFSPQDMDRYTELRSKPNQHLVLGDTTYVLAGAELIMTIVLTAVTIAAVYVLLPGYTGRSPGKLVGRLRILTVHGDVVDTSHTLVRSVVGLVDVLPVVVPGMVGTRLARRSPLGQRLGDRVAGTVVVDASRPLAVVGLTQTPLRLPPPRRIEPQEAATADRPPAPAHQATEGAAGARPAAPPPQHRTATGPAAEPEATEPEATEPEPRGAEQAEATDTSWADIPADPVPAARSFDHRSGWGTSVDDVCDEAVPLARPPAPDWLGDLATVLTPHRPATARGRAPAPSAPVGSPTGGSEPVWSDEWQAWLHYDHTREAWYRHDPASGSWEPLS